MRKEGGGAEGKGMAGEEGEERGKGGRGKREREKQRGERRRTRGECGAGGQKTEWGREAGHRTSSHACVVCV